MKIPYRGAGGSLFVVALALHGGVLRAGEKEVQYGKYLVEEVAQCQRCHTPKLESGDLDKSKWLKGATLDIQPVDTIKDWHKTSPDLTPSGRLWQRWTEAGLLKFMVTGLGPKGNTADPPMPAYKLTQKDAEAVVAYLKSLK
jgi:mono/diheme cytochrome c family protein